MKAPTPEELAALHAACFDTPRPWSAKEFAALLAAGDVFLLAEATGFALGRVLLDEAELLTLAVDPAARRRGTGRRLLAEFERRAVLAGADKAFLEVSAENAAARRLYESVGYREAGLRRGYYRAPGGRRLDALVLGRKLG